jgi:Fic family protein
MKQQNNPSQTEDIDIILSRLLRRAITGREVGHASILLAFIIVEKINTNNFKFYLTAEEVVKNLGVSRETYYKWLRALINKGYLTRIGTNYYVLNP